MTDQQHSSRHLKRVFSGLDPTQTRGIQAMLDKLQQQTAEREAAPLKTASAVGEMNRNIDALVSLTETLTQVAALQVAEIQTTTRLTRQIARLSWSIALIALVTLIITLIK